MMDSQCVLASWVPCVTWSLSRESASCLAVRTHNNMSPDVANH